MAVKIRRIVYAAATLVATALLFAAGGRLMLRALEGRLIYFPTRVRSEVLEPRIAGAGSVEEVWLESDGGVRIHGIYARAREPIADLLFFHGNAGNLYDRTDNVADLVGAGFNVLIIDYRGYGKSEGSPSERGIYADGEAALAYLKETHAVDTRRLVLFGRSLGSTVAIELAMREPFGALIVESAFTSVQEMAQLHYGWLPGLVRRGMRHEFDSISKVPHLKAPALYVHGSRDDIVPLAMGRQLYESSPEPKEWYPIDGAGHNDTVILGGREYYERLVEFVKAHLD